jgi:hypothetical protein
MKKLIVLFFLMCCKTTFSQAISIKGSWFAKVDPNLITNAGLDYDSNLRILSLPNQSIFTLENNNPLNKTYSSSWRLDVQMIDSFWPSSLRIAIQRTSAGKSTGVENILGGTVFQNLGPNPETFIHGKGLVSDVALQYTLSGLSVLIPVDTYSTNIVFTLIEE